MQHNASWDDDEPDEERGSDDALLDLLGPCSPVGDVSDDTDWCRGNHDGSGSDARSAPEVSFTVANPSRTLSATVGLGGQPLCIDMTDVSRLDEAQLGEEIVALATLAREKALAAQHEVTVALMSNRGQDRVAASALLQHAIGLPTYEAASAHAAEVFATRCRPNDD